MAREHARQRHMMQVVRVLVWKPSSHAFNCQLGVHLCFVKLRLEGAKLVHEAFRETKCPILSHKLSLARVLGTCSSVSGTTRFV